MTVFFLLLPLLSAGCYVALAKQFDTACKISHVLYAALVVLTFYGVIHFHSEPPVNFKLLFLPQINLNLLFTLDKLALLMLLLISVISFVVNRYAACYVYSDLNRSRFMFQLSLVTFSVIFLVLSANLLTAFIGWQLIGFHLYWLLNHYHYDENANRAAKKKFVINRIGDISFLLAVMMSLYYYSSTDFQTLFSLDSPTVSIFQYLIPIRTIILTCVFIAVMTKSAQFPFHIWLPDTMQTPTPVSAMMHAGVINAGGYLLARLAPGLIATPNLLIFISCIGFITLLLGNVFALTQPDIKKQLAYSTMSQMGYMVLQCGLGCFAGAVFHLISHGFFKAWTFLNSGNQLLGMKPKQKKNNIISHLISLSLCIIVIAVTIYMSESFQQLWTNFPLLAVFLAITLYQLINTSLNQKMNIQITSISIGLIIAIFIGYLYLIVGYDSALKSTFSNITAPLISKFQYIAIAGAILFYIIYPFVKYNTSKTSLFSYVNYLISHKLFVEETYRKYLLEPMRDFGDILYQVFIQSKGIFFSILGLVFFHQILKFYGIAVNPLFSYVLYLIVLMAFLLIANRARQLKHIFLFLSLAQFTLALIALQGMSANSIKIASFQFINTTLLSLLMLIVLRKIKYGQKMPHMIDNNLPWLGAYLTAVLFCLIGLPCTSTFISEIIILKEVVVIHPLLAIGILLAIVLFAISILHTLQDYIFKGSAIAGLSIRLSKLDHSLFTGILLFDFLNGVYPSYILKLL